MRLTALLLSIGTLAGCAALPHVGPNKSQIYAGSIQREGDAFIVSVNDRVTKATAVVPALGFSQSFRTAQPIGSDTISPGDTLSLTIWENVDDGLLVSEGMNFTQLDGVQVDDDGYIFVPYAGRIQAAGNTPDAIRQLITTQLSDQTPDPQVEVRREAGDGATITLGGAIAAQGIYPIQRPTRNLSSMLAAAGGPTVKPEIAQVTVTRGTQKSTVWYQDIFTDPKADIALRNGDRILVEGDPRSFIVLGAAGQQSTISFDNSTMSGVEALARAGGLQTNAADPTGIFIFRNEPEAIAESVLGRNDLTGAQRMVYVLNLNEPNGIFLARDFLIQDGDVIYVTEAPFTQWNKTIATLTGSLSSAATVNSVASLAN